MKSHKRKDFIKKVVEVLFVVILTCIILAIPKSETAQAASETWITIDGGATYDMPYIQINGTYGLKTMRKLNSDGRTAQYVALLDYKKGTIKYLTDYNILGDGGNNAWSEGWAIVGQKGASKYANDKMHTPVNNWTYINTSGKRINNTWYYHVTKFYNGLAVVKFYGKSNEPYTAIIDTKGKELIRTKGDVPCFIREGHFRLGDKYYDFQLNQLDIDDKESNARNVPGFQLKERDAFLASYGSQYDKIKYAGSSRFVVEKDGKCFVVNASNKILSKKYNLVFPFYTEKTLLFTYSNSAAGASGMMNKDGESIVPMKYYFFQAVTGDSFAAVGSVNMYPSQYVFSTSGNLLMKETSSDLIIRHADGAFTQMRSYNYDGQIPTTQVAYYYGDPEVISYTCSTKVLKDILKQCDTSPDLSQNKAARYMYSQAIAMAKKATGNSFQVLNLAASCARMIQRINDTIAPSISGKYFFTPVATKKMEWTVPGGIMKEGVDIQLYTANGKPEHLFQLKEYNDGTYSITGAGNKNTRFLRSENGVLELGWKKNFSYKANFKLTKADNGGYYIQDYNNLYLTYHSTDNYAPLTFEKKSDDITSQTFMFHSKSTK